MFSFFFFLEREREREKVREVVSENHFSAFFPSSFLVRLQQQQQEQARDKMAETIEERFKKAVWLIRNGPAEKSSNETKLLFYSYFKQVKK